MADMGVDFPPCVCGHAESRHGAFIGCHECYCSSYVAVQSKTECSVAIPKTLYATFEDVTGPVEIELTYEQALQLILGKVAAIEDNYKQLITRVDKLVEEMQRLRGVRMT